MLDRPAVCLDNVISAQRVTSLSPPPLSFSPTRFQSLTSRQLNLLRVGVHLLCVVAGRSSVKNESIHYRLGLSTTKAGRAAAAGKLINSHAAAHCAYATLHIITFFGVAASVAAGIAVASSSQ